MKLSRKGRPPKVEVIGDGKYYAVEVKGITYKFRARGFQVRALPVPKAGNKTDREYARAIVLEHLRKLAVTTDG